MAKRNLCHSILNDYFKKPSKAVVLGPYKIEFYHWGSRVAMVYNSIHHYKYSVKYHKTYDNFKAMQHRDRKIREFCTFNQITLITVPHYTSCVQGLIRRKLGIPNDCRCSSCRIN